MPAVRNERKRALGSYLRALRGRRFVHRDVAVQLGCSDSKVSRMENGWIVPQPTELASMLDFYEASDTQREEAWELWNAARQSTPRVATGKAVSSKLRPLFREEATATDSRVVCPTLVHGLLQTERYARALTFDKGLGAVSDVDAFVRARIKRQQRLHDEPRLVLDVVLAEAAVRLMVGGRAVMREQLLHLVELGRQDNITIRLLPFVAGAYRTAQAAVNLIRGAGSVRAFIDYPGGGLWIEDSALIKDMEDAFDETRRMALSPGETATFLTGLARELDR